MSTITTGADQRSTADTNGSWLGDRKTRANSSRLRGGRRRRSIPYLVLGALLVLACAAGFALLSVTAGDRQPVLALTRPVGVGQMLTAPDLHVVNVAVDPGVAIVSGSQTSQVVGRVLATSLPAGSLLTPGVLGDGTVPGAGRAVAALALKAGQFPPEITPGARVSVVSVPSSTTTPIEPTPASARTWTATVLSVTGRANEQTTVVSVELDEGDAVRLAAVPAGQVSVVMLAARGGR